MVSVMSITQSGPPATRLLFSGVSGGADFIRVYRSSIYEDEFVLAEVDAASYDDFTAINGVQHTYRVVEVSGSIEGDEGSTSHTLPIKDWWLVDLDDIGSSIELFVDGSSSLNISSREDQAKFQPLGRRTPIVIKDDKVKAEEAEFTIQLLGHEQVAAFHALRAKQKALLLQSPVVNQQWFFVFGPEVVEQILNVVDDYRLVRFEMIEVDRPALVPYQ